MAMFRLGSFLFIPAYLTVTLYRILASANDDGNFFLMTGESNAKVIPGAHVSWFSLFFSPHCEHVSMFIRAQLCWPTDRSVQRRSVLW